MAILLPNILKPNAIELFTLQQDVIDISKTKIKFKKWNGNLIDNTLGGKPLIDYDGMPMFAELGVMKIFQSSGWLARWIATYSANKLLPFHFSHWDGVKLKEQKTDPITDKNLL